jgi:hypothetical protein
VINLIPRVLREIQVKLAKYTKATLTVAPKSYRLAQEY